MIKEKMIQALSELFPDPEPIVEEPVADAAADEAADGDKKKKPKKKEEETTTSTTVN